MHFLIAFVLALISVFAFGVSTNNVEINSLEHWTGVAQTPAQLAGLEAGDTIVSVNGQPLRHSQHHPRRHHELGRKPVTLGVERDGHLRSIVVTPRDGRGVQGRQPHPGPVERQDAAGLHRHVNEEVGLGVGEPDPRHRQRRSQSRLGHLGARSAP